MYELTFNRNTMKDLLTYGYKEGKGRQLYGAILCPYSGVFSHKSSGSSVTIPKLVCPYQVNDIIAIQEQWARSEGSYIYKINPEVDSDVGFYPNWRTPDTSGTSFRPASTMPLSATRLYARITSVRTWTLTPDIYANYINPNMSDTSCAGVGKVIGHYDTGNRLLSKVRSKHNSRLLLKSSQSRISQDLPLVSCVVSYYSNQTIDLSYTRGFYDFSPSTRIVYLGEQDRAQAYDSPMNESVPAYSHVYNGTNSSSQQYQQLLPLDPYNRAWYSILSADPDLETKYPNWYEYIGEALFPPAENPFLPTAVWTRPSWGSSYWYFQLDGSSDIQVTYNGETRYFGKRIPVYQTYSYNIVDPEKYLFVWLISGYLSDKDGNIQGGIF